ncbi:MAG: hypothetical protein ACTHM2_06420 [Afipia sp.]
MNDNLMQAVDALSASPAIRLRYQMLAAKVLQSATPCLPPPIQHRAEHQMRPPTDYASHLAAHGHPLAPLVRLRQEAADQIERLIAFLDATEGGFEDVLDGDEDAAVDDAGCDEDFDKEPALGFVESHPAPWDEGNGWWWAYHSEEGAQNIPQGGDDDREADDADLEPSLCGVTANFVPVTQGEGLDLEDDGDDEPDSDSEPDADTEPSLGWPERMAQGVCHGAADDRETAVGPGPGTVQRSRRRYRQRDCNVRIRSGKPVVIRVMPA